MFLIAVFIEDRSASVRDKTGPSTKTTINIVEEEPQEENVTKYVFPKIDCTNCVYLSKNLFKILTYIASLISIPKDCMLAYELS